MKSIFFIVLLSTSVIFSQELNCTVNVSLEALAEKDRVDLQDFAQIIQGYMNNTVFTNENFDGEKIECNMTIYFTGAPGNNNYNAQLFIGSKRPVFKSQKSSPMLTIMDNNWGFDYDKGQGLYRNESVYDPITSFLDFYALLIISYDMDSFEDLSGTTYYSKAMDIVNLGANSKFNSGWQKTTGSYSRRGFVEDLLNEKYRAFREAFFQYHYNGIDLYTTQKQEAQKNIAALVYTLDKMRSKIDINSILIKSFFDAKHGEIIEYLSDYPQKAEVFQILRKIDPPHASKYDQAMK